MLTIRDLVQTDEVEQVVELEQEVWGVSDRDVTPVTHLVAAREAGGILLGAFDGAVLAGFVYGFVGYEQLEITLHSHMLAVKPAYRKRNLGYRLKLAQREQALAKGIKRMTWTFDPLQSLNAYFNFCKLGVVANLYKINLYGESTSSFLHRSGTDRLWVNWQLASMRVKNRLETQPKCNAGDLEAIYINDAPLPLIRVGEDESPIINDNNESLTRSQALIEIPASIDELQESKPGSGSKWREATRQAFSAALAAGFTVEEFYRSGGEGRPYGAYLLRK